MLVAEDRLTRAGPFTRCSLDLEMETTTMANYLKLEAQRLSQKLRDKLTARVACAVSLIRSTTATR